VLVIVGSEWAWPD